MAVSTSGLQKAAEGGGAMGLFSRLFGQGASSPEGDAITAAALTGDAALARSALESGSDVNGAAPATLLRDAAAY